MIETSVHMEAREAVVRALQSSDAPSAAAAAFEEAATAVARGLQADGTGTSVAQWRLAEKVLRLTALLYRWDAAIREAEKDSDRNLRAAKREAQIQRKQLVVLWYVCHSR